MSLPADEGELGPSLRDILKLSEAEAGPQKVIFEDDMTEVEIPGSRGRITVYCTAENLDFKKVSFWGGAGLGAIARGTVTKMAAR